MRYLLLSLSIAFLFFSCQQKSETLDLAGKKALLVAEKKKLKELQHNIDTLIAAIEKEEPPKKLAKKSVAVMQLQSETFEHFSEIQATVMSDDVVMASSETGGRITYLNAKEGQSVRKGALIAKVDVEAINSQVAEVKTNMALAQDTYNRQKRLWEQNIGSEMQYIQAKNAVEQIEKRLETLNTQLSKANVYAPLSGAIDMVMLKEGEICAPGQPIVQILNTYKVKVVANLPETYLGKVKQGEKVEIYFPALDLTRTARVSLMGRTIDPANRTFKVEINMSNKDQKLKPNLLATVKINDFSAKDAFVLDQELVQQDLSGKEYVLVVGKKDDHQVAVKKFVESGQSYDGRVQIAEGLSVADKIITKGARTVSEGDPIEYSVSEPNIK
jgi:RND family efflux transporter MFP subunit